MVVKREDFADACSGGEQIGELVSDVRRSDVDCDDTQQVGGGASLLAVLNQSVLHDADQRTPVGCDGQTFHALVSGSPYCVFCNFGITDWRQVGDKKRSRQLKRTDT